MARHMLFLTGAPQASELDWSSCDLTDDFSSPVARFAGIPCSDTGLTSTPTFPRHAAWRSLDLYRKHIPTGHSQTNGLINDNAAFFVNSRLSFTSTGPDGSTTRPLDSQNQLSSTESVLSQFYEQSFAVHENTTSSQSQSSSETEQQTNSNETSFSVSPTPRKPIPDGANIHDLKDIPNAKYILSIQPHALKVNLIVGIISICPPRPIKTRYGAEVEIIELLVGDNTKSGFGINIWLQQRSSNSAFHRNDDGHDIREVLCGVRPQDVLLLKNVTVASFRGKVYGQSVRKEMTRAYLLFRNRVDRTDIGGCYTLEDLVGEEDANWQVMKTKRVKEWVQRFVAPVAFRQVSNRGIQVIEEQLPPDTQ